MCTDFSSNSLSKKPTGPGETFSITQQCTIMKRKPANLLSSIRSLILPAVRMQVVSVSNNDILDELVACFDYSCRTEPVGSCLIFNMHFMVILHPDVYEQRLPSLPVIVKEAVKIFYQRISFLQKKYAEVSPVSSQWQFRFGPGAEFNNEKVGPSDIRVLGMLTGPRNTPGSLPEKQHTARVTMKVKATNVFDKLDLNMDVLRHIHFVENGLFTVKYQSDFTLPSYAGLNSTANKQTRSFHQSLAEISCFNGEKNRSEEFVMKDKEIVIARKEDNNQGYNNYLLIDSSFVSNPHARIRWNDSEGKFQIASFSNHETRVNEVKVGKSEAGAPQWFELPDMCQVLLNGMVTLEFKKTGI
jgi:hypothetical protein